MGLPKDTLHRPIGAGRASNIGRGRRLMGTQRGTCPDMSLLTLTGRPLVDVKKQKVVQLMLEDPGIRNMSSRRAGVRRPDGRPTTMPRTRRSSFCY